MLSFPSLPHDWQQSMHKALKPTSSTSTTAREAVNIRLLADSMPSVFTAVNKGADYMR